MWVHTFPKSTSLKVNIIAQLDFKFAYDNVSVQHVSHYSTETQVRSGSTW